MRNLTWRQIAVVLACVLTLATFVVGVYGLARGQRSASTGGLRPAETLEVVPESTAPDLTVEDRALPRTADPLDYARAVATSILDWDTGTGLLPSDYGAAVLADADPSGEEVPGLIVDVATYLPTTGQWLDLAALGVRQSVVIDDAYVPESWTAALNQARGRLRPGTTAVTIIGTRHRTGVWKGESAESSYPISFTVFVACLPAFDRCHVLRLSQLDKPLR